MHSTNSDGKLPPQEAVNLYKSAGYDFVALSDHFMERYQYTISDTRCYRDESFTTIVATELHAPATSLGELWHIHALGVPLDFAPLGPRESGPEVARRAAAAGAFIGIVHPSWYGLTVDDARSIDVAHAVEIYNHGSALEVDRGYDWPFCDQLLNLGWRLGAYATDDSHLWDDDGFGGWVEVKAPALTPESLLEALKAGHYYSSQGPKIYNIEYDAARVWIRCSAAVSVSISGRGSRAAYQRGEDLREVELPLDRFPDGYFRVTVIDAEGKRAWSNPFWRDECGVA